MDTSVVNYESVPPQTLVTVRRCRQVGLHVDVFYWRTTHALPETNIFLFRNNRRREEASGLDIVVLLTLQPLLS